MSVQVGNTTINGVEGMCKLSGFSYNSYLGIPYAKPPIGNLRFQAPQKPDELEEEFDATLEGDDCIQISRSRPGTIGSEDCLYINVYVPKTDDEDGPLKPVVVYVHGGLFTYFSGSSNYFAPDYLLPHDIIVVSINYRLHVLGFLDLGLPDCPGNVGLKDQVMALQWIKENIKCFGGDPDNITAFGTSSGAASLHILSMSPLTRDLNLFQKLIMLSGNALIRPVVTDSVRRAFEFGHRLGYRGKSREGLLKFMRNVPADELVEGLLAYQKFTDLENGGNVLSISFMPSVETLEHDDVIIPQQPYVMVKDAKNLPLITGMMAKEGMFAFYVDPFVLNYLREDFTACIGRLLPTLDEKILPEVADMIKVFYFKNKDIDFNSGKETTDFYTDILYTRGFYEMNNFKEVSDQWPVYAFHFLYDGPLNCYKKYYPVWTRLMDGPTHDDVLGYLLPFKNDLASRFSSKRDIKIIKNLSALCTNFIKNGNPNGNNVNIKWKAFNLEEPSYLQVNENLKICNGYINEERYKFWVKINKIIAEGKIENEDEEGGVVATV